MQKEINVFKITLKDVILFIFFAAPTAQEHVFNAYKIACIFDWYHDFSWRYAIREGDPVHDEWMIKKNTAHAQCAMPIKSIAWLPR